MVKGGGFKSNENVATCEGMSLSPGSLRYQWFFIKEKSTIFLCELVLQIALKQVQNDLKQ